MRNRKYEQALDEIVDFGDGSFRINRSAGILTRRRVMSGLAAGSVTLGVGTAGIVTASAAIPGSGLVAEVLSKTFANVFSEVAAFEYAPCDKIINVIVVYQQTGFITI